MPSTSEKQRVAMAIAEHEPSKLYKRNKGMSKMTHQQLHEYAMKVGKTKSINKKKKKTNAYANYLRPAEKG